MEKQLQEAETTSEPFVLRRYVLALSLHRRHFTKDNEARFLFLCQRLRETMRAGMPAA